MKTFEWSKDNSITLTFNIRTYTDDIECDYNSLDIAAAFQTLYLLDKRTIEEECRSVVETLSPKQDERNPPPPVDEPTYLPEDEQEAPVEDKPSGSGPTSEPEPEVNGVTREQLQALIKSHLKKFQSGSPEMDAEKKALIDLMLKTTETASSFTAPEDKLGAAFDAITAYMESK